MKLSTAVMGAAVAAVIAATGTIGTPTASADTKVTTFGTWERLRDANGAVITAWNIYDLEPSDDTIPEYPLAGTLWEASAAVMPIRGTVTPIIPNLNARTDSGQNYRVLWQAYAPNGISGETLSQGDKSKGEIYFDVSGPPPTKVVYNNGVEDLIVWQN
ncbi:MAG TPA: MPT63 family protein [Mycobacterium sp.]|nr:MPT63 family protein [Mycobacterium sp.]